MKNNYANMNFKFPKKYFSGELCIWQEFSAMHFLPNVKKCKRIHGHNWRVQVCIQGERLNKQGMLIDFRLLKKWVKEEVDKLDHHPLNFFIPITTAEVLSMYLFFKLWKKVVSYGYLHKGIKYWVSRVGIQETKDTYVEYTLESFIEDWKNEKSRVGREVAKKWHNSLTLQEREVLRQKISQGISKETRKMFSERMKKNNPMFDRQNVEKMIKSLSKSIKIKPNKPEKQLIQLFKKHRLPFQYTGDGSYLIKGKVPDFINFEKKKIIELFGRFWHSNNNQWYDTKNDERERIDFFKKNGFDCLVIWDDELENEKELIKRIKSYYGED